MVDFYKVFKPSEKFKQVFTGGTLEPPKFIPTYYEWLRAKGERLIQGGSATIADTYAVYTVPKGKTLFLTSAILGVDDCAVDRINPILWIDGAGGVRKFMTVSAEANSQETVALSFPIPLQFVEDEQIVLTFLANAFVTYSLTGFLVKNDYIPQI